MTCRYCGESLQARVHILWSRLGKNCASSPTKLHVALAEGMMCVYCGDALRSVSQKLVSSVGAICANSPTKQHCLQS